MIALISLLPDTWLFKAVFESNQVRKRNRGPNRPNRRFRLVAALRPWANRWFVYCGNISPILGLPTFAPNLCWWSTYSYFGTLRAYLVNLPPKNQRPKVVEKSTSPISPPLPQPPYDLNISLYVQHTLAPNRAPSAPHAGGDIAGLRGRALLAPGAVAAHRLPLLQGSGIQGPICITYIYIYSTTNHTHMYYMLICTSKMLPFCRHV